MNYQVQPYFITFFNSKIIDEDSKTKGWFETEKPYNWLYFARLCQSNDECNIIVKYTNNEVSLQLFESF
jgi:hypothetical protein